MKKLEQIKRYANGEHCYDCGSEFEGHHTPLCAFSEETDELDIPAKPGTQHVDRKHPAYVAMLKASKA